MRNLFFLSTTLLILLPSLNLSAQAGKKIDIPSIYSNIEQDNQGMYVRYRDTLQYREVTRPAEYTLQQMIGKPYGTDEGIAFDFGPNLHHGTLYYGFIPSGDSKYPHPVYFRSSSRIDTGITSINILRGLSGIYDMVGWQKSGKGTLGYRVLNEDGEMLYDGIVSFQGTGPFTVVPTIIEGPFINKHLPTGTTISFTTNEEVRSSVEVNGQRYGQRRKNTQHEIDIDGLTADTEYQYTIFLEDAAAATYSFRTAPTPGSRKPFVFAYTSDSRSGNGGGERSMFGANFYIMKKILAVTRQQGAAFMQFTGDLIDGYLMDPGEIDLQYANWKRAIQPFAHYFPVYTTMGNHEALMRVFTDDSRRVMLMVDRFPFDTESSEAVYNRNFVNFENGPDSEDGADYDPDPRRQDFPSYKENVYYHIYDNVAVIALNSDYFYSPSTAEVRNTSGNIHGYILDKQLEWLESTVNKLEQDPNIDHIFVTQHTPCFPNGGHVRDDMWYNGNNQFRPFVAGKPNPKGIIERRDQILDILVNRSKKVKAILTGDEHNYNRLHLTPETKIYPETYFFPKIELTRSIYQINNGAAGAPYYAQEQTPWTPHVTGFTTQNAVVFFHVNGKNIEVKVINPDTLEMVDEFKLE